MTTQDRANLVCKAASAKSMSARIWEGGGETRVYLSRTNAARTEAGYIRFFKNDEGKPVSKLVITATGPGSRTCESEADSVFASYKTLRNAAIAAKKEGK